jgi:hypothetical protein
MYILYILYYIKDVTRPPKMGEEKDRGVSFVPRV